MTSLSIWPQQCRHFSEASIGPDFDFSMSVLVPEAVAMLAYCLKHVRYHMLKLCKTWEVKWDAP